MYHHQSMRRSPDRPVAVRATAFLSDSRWRGRPNRRVSFDAWWPDGRVEVDVPLASTMRQHPADFSALEEQLLANCPKVGVGPWLDEVGREVEGPDDSAVPATPVRRGTAHVSGERRPGLTAAERRGWRVALGLVMAAIGAALLGVVRDGPAGPIGVVCVLVGVAALAGLLPREKRWW